jgi:hypothetical protein
MPLTLEERPARKGVQLIKPEGTAHRKMLVLGIALMLPWLIGSWRLAQRKAPSALVPVQAGVHSGRSAEARARDWLAERAIQADEVFTFPGVPTVKIVRYCESDAQLAGQAPYRWPVWSTAATVDDVPR